MELKNVLKWWKGKDLNSVKDYITVLGDFREKYIYHSSKLDGACVAFPTVSGILEGRLLAKKSIPSKAVLAINNYNDALSFLLEEVVKKTPITCDFVYKLHHLMTKGCYSSGLSSRDNTFAVEDTLDLIDELNSSTDDVLNTVSYFIAAFETISPFWVGNGKVCRALANYYLMFNGYPPIIIEESFKGVYKSYIKRFAETGDYEEFTTFINNMLVCTWEYSAISYSEKEMNRLREVAPVIYKGLSDIELWNLLGKYLPEIDYIVGGAA